MSSRIKPVLVENSATGLDQGLRRRHQQRSCMSRSPTTKHDQPTKHDQLNL
jgi:hypothetical protein